MKFLSKLVVALGLCLAQGAFAAGYKYRVPVSGLAISSGLSGVQSYGTYSAWGDGTYAASCLGYLTGDASHSFNGSDGVYRLSLAGTTVDTYCDMTNGGYTLVSMRTNSTAGTETSVLSAAEPTTPQYLPDAVWMALRGTSTLLRAVPTGNALDVANIITMSKVTGAICNPLASSLSSRIIFHAETSGCDGTGYDYTILGWSGGLGYVSNSGAVHWDIGLYDGIYYSGLTLWVK